MRNFVSTAKNVCTCIIEQVPNRYQFRLTEIVNNFGEQKFNAEETLTSTSRNQRQKVQNKKTNKFIIFKQSVSRLKTKYS